MKILVFGGVTGWVGQRVVRDMAARHKMVATSERLRLADCLRSIHHNEPELVVNAAGVTGRPNVDWCESHAEETYAANVVGALELGDACRKAGVPLLHIGSGCIFFGKGRYFDESAQPNPRTVYTRSKYAADLGLLDMGHTVVRIRMPLSRTPHPRNLITKLRAYPRVVGDFGSVTDLDGLGAVVCRILDSKKTGLFHAVNPGQLWLPDLAPGRPTMTPRELRDVTRAERSSAVVTSARLTLPNVRDALPELLRAYDAAEADAKNQAF